MIEDKPIVEQELGFALRDTPEDQPEGVQVAALGRLGGILSDVWKTRGVKSQDVVDRFRENQGVTQGPTKDQIDMILDDVDVSTDPAGAPSQPGSPLPPVDERVSADILAEYQQTDVPSEKRTAERNINIHRHHEGAIANPDLERMDPDVAIENMETADDIARLLDASARVQGLAEGPRTQAEIAARTETFEQSRDVLREVFQADPKAIGALTDVQLHAARRMLATLGDQTVTLANQIGGGDQTPETLLTYQRKTEAFAALHAFVQGKVKEAARALSQQRMIAQTLQGHDINQVADFIELGTSYRTPEDVAMHAANLSRKAAEMGNSEALVDSTKPGWRDYWKAGVEYWANNILSGVETMTINLTSSPLVVAYEGVVVNNLASGIGQLRNIANLGPQERVTAQEQVARMAGAGIGLRDGLSAFFNTLISGQAAFGPEKGEEVRGAMHKVFGHFGEAGGRITPGVKPEVGRKVGETAAEAMTLSFRGLSAGDALWKTNVFRSEFTALAVREAYAKDVDDVGDYVMRALESPERYPDIYHQAMDRARRYTFTDTDREGFLGDMARNIKKFVAQYPAVKFFIPFVDTPINLVHYAVENSALAPLSRRLREDFMAGGARSDIAASRVISGIGMTLLAYDLVSDEDYVNTGTEAELLGQGPSSWQERRLREMTNWSGDSLFIDGKYYAIDRLDPFAMSVFATVNTLEKAKFAKEEYGMVEGMVKASLELANQAVSATYAKGLKDFLDVLQGRKDVDKYIAGYVSGLVPYSGFQKSVKKAVDPQPRKLLDDKKFETELSDLISQRIRSGNPAYSASMVPARNWDGSLVLPRNGKPVHMMNFLDYVEEVASPVKVREGRPYDRATSELAANGLGPGMPEPVVTVQGVTFSLLSLDNELGLLYDAYAVEVGKATREAIEELITEDVYREATAGYDSERRQMLSGAISAGKQQGLSNFLENDLREYIVKYPEQVSELTLLFGVRGVDDLLEIIREDTMDPLVDDYIAGKFEVPKQGKSGALPVPPHMQEEQDIMENMPEF